MSLNSMINSIILRLYIAVKSSLLYNDDEPPTGYANVYNNPKHYYEEKQGGKFDWGNILKPKKNLDVQCA